MATRNERKRAAKARHAELQAAVKDAFSVEQAKVAETQARHEALIAVNKWTRKGTHTICHPGLDKVV
jgi:hypothetical protein